ncbi:beta-galactosidase [Stylosanthes scabra]|uniref:Beta-galactosidase n=1 Tax=Stylosanthes scabra TaxID=79078 RepID=A0ABU6RLF1_9FABA|nr:beta-galactosidase [Stylosanthes scabra]
MAATWSCCSILVILSMMMISSATAVAPRPHKPQNVTYDGRSLFINGRRELLFSGSIHYPRSTPDMWPALLDKARHGGLNTIDTYVFWNLHEPEKGKFNFKGNADLVKFIKLIQERGMYVILRLGPFIQAEWNHGGLPYWLRDIPGMYFRTYNEAFKMHMEEYVRMIVEMMKENKLFANQGGPIVLAQIENEYNQVQRAYRHNGNEGLKYVKWAAQMAVDTHIGVPWIMCKQKDAPDPVINACNGRHCGDVFTPNKPYKPRVWTENWTVQFREYGDDHHSRSAEDIAFSIARFFSKDGSVFNYYMYHGGTNFGRSAAAFKPAAYYDEAPLDEYGMTKEPKWGHLRDLHRALNLCKKPLLVGKPTIQKLNQFHEITIYEKPGTPICAAFLFNNHTRKAATINFRGKDFYVPGHSITILPDCKNEVFNTYNILAQHSHRTFTRSKLANNHKWEVYSETIPTSAHVKSNMTAPPELFSFLKDTSDYAWFTVSFDINPEDMPKDGSLPYLFISSGGHGLLAFSNGECIGSGHGTSEHAEFDMTIRGLNLKAGKNEISILDYVTGLTDSGSYMERRSAGVGGVMIKGLANGNTVGLLEEKRYLRGGFRWGGRVGLEGEKMKIYTRKGSKKVSWEKVGRGVGRALSWYKTKFMSPEGREPVAIRMTGMKKGMMWVNGKGIGRHWVDFKVNGTEEPTQSVFHIPRSFLNPSGDNLLVILEEQPSNPKDIQIELVDRNTVCSFVHDYFAPAVQTWKGEQVLSKPHASVKCPNKKKIASVEFASFGNPSGSCGSFQLGKCNFDPALTRAVVEKACLGKESCKLPVDPALFGASPRGVCSALPFKTLAIQVKCSF